MSLKFTPENITSLGDDEIFVFGSDPKGLRIGPAEETAIKYFGASREQPVGIFGQSYAIPTMFDSVDKIKPYVDDFISLAYEWDQTTFYITRIGCGQAGFTDAEIAPLFAEALPLYNIRLPESFYRILTADNYGSDASLLM